MQPSTPKDLSYRICYLFGYNFGAVLLGVVKGLFISSESGSESENDQMTSQRDQRINDKYQRKFLLSLPISLGENGFYLKVF